MKRLAWLLPLLFVAAVTAAPPSLPQQGATALSTFLKGATDRGDVPGVVVAVVDKNGVHEVSNTMSQVRQPLPNQQDVEAELVANPYILYGSILTGRARSDNFPARVIRTCGPPSARG